MSKAPEVCMVCDGHGNPKNGGSSGCGFCIKGSPLDTQEDWDTAWGGLHEKAVKFAERLMKERNA